MSIKESDSLKMKCFIQDYLNLDSMPVGKIEDDEKNGFYINLFNKKNRPRIELWYEDWEEDPWNFCLAVGLTQKAFFTEFPNYKTHEYYDNNCWDLSKKNVEHPRYSDFSLQKAGKDEFYLSLYIRLGSERQDVLKFFENDYVKRICGLKANDEITTERLQESWARVGQGKYREEMLKLWENKCAVTGSAIQEALIASHAKPWADCTNASERLKPL